MWMRQALQEFLEEQMRLDPSVVVLDADLAKATGTLPLRQEFPDRALDVGIAEQNMVSIAAGMASCGFKPYVSSFAPFMTRRVCDQIAISVLYAGQNVKLVGTDPGIAAELNGGTHFSVEDMGVLRSLPGMVIFEPSDIGQLRKALPQIHAYPGCVYLRLFRKELPQVFDENEPFELFRAQTMRPGRDVVIFVSGILAQEALEARELLAAGGISARVVNIHTIKPLDEDAVLRHLAETGCGVTVENHSVLGGLHSAVSELACSRMPAPVLAVGIRDRFGEVGRMPYLKSVLGLTAQDIAGQARRAVELKSAGKGVGA